ncbi:MAG: hypothetical protein M3R61_21500, partial [Chloroflexota bacterium]|nr:hypothetical protein [Chloroflexota bacterium]
MFIFALGLRFVVLSRFAASPHFLPDSDDMRFYNDWALRIVGGQFTDYQAFYGLPGYAFCLAGIYTVGGFNPYLVGLIQIFCDALTAVVVFKIATLLFSRGIAIQRANFIGVMAAAGWTLYQPAQTFSVILMPTSGLVCAYWACVWWVARKRS